MNPQSLHRSVDAERGPGLREYGSVFLVLLASRLLGEFVADGFEATRELLSDALDPQLVGAVVYAALGLAVLGAAYAARRRLRPTRAAPERHELFTLAGATAMLLLFGAYLLHGAVDLPAFPGDVVPSLLAGGVTAGAGLLYARSRDIDLRIEAPKRDALPATGLTILVGALAGLGWILALEIGGNPVFRPAFAGVFGPEPQLRVGELFWNAVLPNLFVGVGLGVLYNGAVQEGLRERVGAAGAAAAVTTLIGVTAWGSGEFARVADAPPTILTAAVVVLLGVLGASIAVRGTRFLQRTRDADAAPIVTASASALVVAVALMAVSALRWYPPGFVASGASYAVVGATAAVGYERSRSLWVPALSFAAYLFVVDPDVALHVSRALG
ncbi:hypothetical protein ACFQDG_05195 [Natronoarchaeum mannanilyticum]|uniref:Uncharacterized protein n=1 Tax=Natronoarchaeum mannanilyticum TaxID=926360 RepID=A0AAV3TCF3_9EURY